MQDRLRSGYTWKMFDEKERPVDPSLVKNGWYLNTTQSRYNPRSDVIRARADDARLTLYRIIQRPVKNGNDNIHVAVVAHGGFLHSFTEDWEESWMCPSASWRNCETRSYVYEDDIVGDRSEMRLAETSESFSYRGKEYSRFGRERQLEFFPVAMQEWEKQGLQSPDEWA